MNPTVGPKLPREVGNFGTAERLSILSSCANAGRVVEDDSGARRIVWCLLINFCSGAQESLPLDYIL